MEEKQQNQNIQKLITLRKEFTKTKSKQTLEKMLEVLNSIPQCENIVAESIRLFVYRKSGKLKQGLECAKNCFDKFEQSVDEYTENVFNRFKNEYGWLIYTYLKNSKFNYQLFKKGFWKIFNLTDGEELIVSSTFLMIFHRLKKENKITQCGFLFSDKLLEHYLSMENSEIKEKILKSVIFYFKNKKEWEKVKKFCLYYKKEFGDDLFVERDYAICLANQGEIAQSLQIFEDKILRHKKDWYIFSDIASIYIQKGDLEKGEEYLLKALILMPKPQLGVQLYEKYGKILENKGLKDESLKHYLFLKQIREENNWQVSDEILNKVKGKSDRISFNEMKEMWLKTLKEKGIAKQGEVYKIFPNGKTGFLNTNGKSYFFQTVKKLKLQQGSTVSFFLSPSYDKKKNRETEIALVL